MLPVERKRLVFEGRPVQFLASQTGRILRQPCRYDLKGTCATSPRECWHPPESQFHKNESGCKAGVKCLILHKKVKNNQIKKAQKEVFKPPKNGKRDDTGAVALVKVPQLGCVSQDSEPSELPKRVKYRETKDLKSAKLETMRISKNPTTVMTVYRIYRLSRTLQE